MRWILIVRIIKLTSYNWMECCWQKNVLWVVNARILSYHWSINIDQHLLHCSSGHRRLLELGLPFSQQARLARARRSLSATGSGPDISANAHCARCWRCDGLLRAGTNEINLYLAFPSSWDDVVLMDGHFMLIQDRDLFFQRTKPSKRILPCRS